MIKLNAVALVTVTMAAFWQPPVAVADSTGAQHGGQYIELQDHHGVEMVATPDAVTFYVTDDHKPMDLAGSQFKAVVQSDQATTVIELVINNGSLKGALKAPLPAGAKIVLSGKDRHGHAIQARFVKQ